MESEKREWPCTEDARFMQLAMQLWEKRALFAYSKRVILHVPPDDDFPRSIEFVPRSDYVKLERDP